MSIFDALQKSRQATNQWFDKNNIDPTVFGMAAMAGAGNGNPAGTLGAALLQGRNARMTAIKEAALAKAAQQASDRKYGLDLYKAQTGRMQAGKPMKVTAGVEGSPGQRVTQLVDPATGQPLFTSDPYATGKGMTVNVGGEQQLSPQDTLAEKMRERDIESILGAKTSAESSAQMLTDIDQFRQVNASGISGPGATTVDAAKRAVSAVGKFLGAPEPLFTEDLATADAIIGKGMDFVMKRIAGTKGSISEKEMALFSQSSPGLAKTEMGNAAMLNFMEAAILSQQEDADMREAYFNRNGSLKGYAEARRAYLRDFPRTMGVEGNFAVAQDNFGQYDSYLNADDLPKPRQESAPQQRAESDIPTLDDGTPDVGSMSDEQLRALIGG